MMESFLAFGVAASSGEPPVFMSFLPLVFMFVIFYFLLIRPQQRRQKEHQNFVNAVQKNDEVVTTGGIHGTVVQVKDATVVIRVADNVRIEVEKGCLSRKKGQAS
ncbi:MAG: preprotein translocase subunit YajC [Candidatus Omnitrophica bacterium]|nr:preprotein translocase subunit YajC [Candidatus Omnitrophota bacterium]